MGFQIVMEYIKVSTPVLLTFLLTACYTNTVQHSLNSATKMAHHNIILNHQTHRIVDANSQNSSNVNFEYQEIVTQ